MAVEFITFGCWNKDECEKTGEPKNGVSATMNLLDDYVNKNKSRLEFIAVSGDNYYPEKKKGPEGKAKFWKESDFRSGFECLPTGVDIRLLMGNHDLESTQMMDTDNAGKMTEPCHIIKSEMAYSPRFDLHSDYRLFGENTIVLFIDTSMYSGMSKEELDCYNTFMGAGHSTVQEAQEEQQTRILDLIKARVKDNAAITNIIIIGHHPIFGIKKTMVETEKMEDSGIEFFLSIKEMIEDTKYSFYYLCADIHNYQRSKITLAKEGKEMEIEQYIVGTGGTDLDTLENEGSDEIVIDSFAEGVPIKEVRLFERMVRYGFLMCKNERGTLTMKFEASPFKPKAKAKKDKTGKKSPKKPTQKRSTPRKSPKITKTYRKDPGLNEFLGGRLRKRRTIKIAGNLLRR